MKSLRLITLAFIASSLTTGIAQKPAPAQPETAQQHLAHGISLASQKHYKAAQLELEKADALQPGDFAILFNLGQVELRNGDTPNAQLTLSRALKLNPNSPETLYLLAQVYTAQSRPLDALDLLTRAKSLAPNNPDILYQMAEIGIAQKYFEDAIPLLEKAQQLAPTRTDIAEALGASDFKADKIDASLTVFTKLIATHPSVVAYAYLGFAHTYLGRFDEAKQDFRNGLKLDPGNSACLFQLGYIAKIQGDHATAEATFLKVLHADPNYANALLELANLRMEQKRFPEAVELLHHYIRLNSNSAAGYYKLAMAERSLHDTAASQRDMARFQTLSKDTAAAAHPYDHLFDYLDSRAKLTPQARQQQDLTSLTEQAASHPDQPEVLYALAEAYLRSNQLEQARTTIASLDQQRPTDTRTLTGLGVLLARYGLYDDAIAQFQSALQATPNSDDTRFDLANAYFRKASYSDALTAAQQVSEPAQANESYSALLADIYAHLGNTTRAEDLYRSAIERNPDNDQDYLSLALLQLRAGQIEPAKQTLARGQARVPGSGKLFWALGLVAVLEGNTALAAKDLERAVDLLPEWPGSYATLGFFYYQTGQTDKAREVLDRFKNSGAHGGLDINRIQATLAQSPPTTEPGTNSLTSAQRVQILQLALYLADKTL